MARRSAIYLKCHVQKDLEVDYRPDGYMRALPIPNTLKELSGILCLCNEDVMELEYNNNQNIAPSGQVYSRHKASISDSFKSGDRLVIWHTHPSCAPTDSEDVKAHKEIGLLFDTLAPENCWDVRYIPKMDKFYWFSLKRKNLLERLRDGLSS